MAKTHFVSLTCSVPLKCIPGNISFPLSQLVKQNILILPNYSRPHSVFFIEATCRMNWAGRSPSAAETGGLRCSAIHTPFLPMGAGGDHRDRLVPALRNVVGGGMTVLANCAVLPRERKTCKAMILLFIMWHVGEVGCKLPGGGIPLCSFLLLQCWGPRA